MTGFNKVSVAVTAAGNEQFVAAAEVCQQPAVLRPVSRMIAFETVQLFICQTGQVFLHAGSVEIAGQVGAKGNTACLMDYRDYFFNTWKIRKA